MHNTNKFARNQSLSPPPVRGQPALRPIRDIGATNRVSQGGAGGNGYQQTYKKGPGSKNRRGRGQWSPKTSGRAVDLTTTGATVGRLAAMAIRYRVRTRRRTQRSECECGTDCETDKGFSRWQAGPVCVTV